MTGELLLMATVADQMVAIRASDVQSVIAIDRIVPVPRSPDHIMGLTAVRSLALTVVDCAAALGIRSRAADTPVTRGLMVACDGNFYALAVDAVRDVTAASGELQLLPGNCESGWQRCAAGMVETVFGPALLMNIGALIEGPNSPNTSLAHAGSASGTLTKAG